MVNSSANSGEFVLVLIGGAIFLLLFAIILEVLRKMSFFNSVTSVVVAFAVSLLSLIGLHRFLLLGSYGHDLPGEGGGPGTGFDLILLPYAALAIAILVMALFLFLSRILRRRSKKRHYQEFYRGVERSRRLEDMDEPVERDDEERHIKK
jgi:hypothetical protein